MRVLIADKLSPRVTAQLEAAGCAVSAVVGLAGPALAEVIAAQQPDVLVVRSTKVGLAHLEAGPSLSLIVRAGAGVDNIAVAAASERGVYVSNCPGKNAIAVAELTFGHLLNIDRRIADNVQALREGKWAKGEYSKADGVAGKTLAVLGVGVIGREVIRRAHAFGLQVRAWSRSLTRAEAAELGVSFCATPLEACAGAQILSVHLALAPETRGLVDRTLLDALAPGATVINTSRGEVMDQDALLDAVERRGLKAGLDVFASEPAGAAGDFTDPIAKHPRVYGTHHIGASTEQASAAVGDEVVRIITTYLREGSVPNCVNLAASSPATHVLVVRHADQVGVLAGILHHLREDHVNVQEMENVIFSGAAAACARIQLDRAPSPATLERVREAEHVFAASVVAIRR
ncbi:MAG: hydroxyacid dehydrogenase [Deltaproteobacteria bacterium]|jgi:D-3-phosphoglycerate dehydrogenase|nr:hydroxyacid dehydrogenase [Deltaproteobacteria bacterium]